MQDMEYLAVYLIHFKATAAQKKDDPEIEAKLHTSGENIIKSHFMRSVKDLSKFVDFGFDLDHLDKTNIPYSVFRQSLIDRYTPKA